MYGDAVETARAMARALGERFGTTLGLSTEADAGADAPRPPYLRVTTLASETDHYDGTTSRFGIVGVGLGGAPTPISLDVEITHHELSGTVIAWRAVLLGAAEADRAFFAAALDPRSRAYLAGYQLGQYAPIDVRVA